MQVCLLRFLGVVIPALLVNPTASDDLPYQFLSAVIGSLSRSNSALQYVNEHLKDPEPVEQMTAIKNGSVELRVAAGEIQQFSSAKNEHMRDAVTSIAGWYDIMQRSLAAGLAAVEKLAAAKSEDDLVSIRRDLSDAKAMNQQASLLLYEATVLAFGSCIVADPKDPNHTALDMTRSEKASLLTKLEKEFGPALKAKPKDEDMGPLIAARVLLKELSQKWRLAR